jgi:phosphoribosyl-dephospho-CoA transferase
MQRHDLVWLQPGAPWRLQGGAPQGPDSSVLAMGLSQWLARELPLVAIRQSFLGPDLLLGLSLPTRLGRHRLCCQVALDNVQRVTAPLGLAQTLSVLPDHWHPALLSFLDAVDQPPGAWVGVYGSLAWEALSGESYRHCDSDLDLIVDVVGPEAVEPTLHALQNLAASLPCRLDGELRLPHGDAVAWRELWQARTHPGMPVLVKGRSDVSLRPVSDWLRTPQAVSHG